MDRKRMSMREGSGYLDGEKVLDMIKLKVVVTPEVAESRAVGQRGKSRRWLGHDITGNLTEYKSTPWLKATLKKYLSSGETPSFTFVGIQDDKSSDYGKSYSNDVITLEGVVFTGDLTVLDIDSEGEHVITEIEFGAENIIIK